MHNEYEVEISVENISGLPTRVKLIFDCFILKLQKLEDDPGYFCCSLIIPNETDDEGNILEYDFNDAFGKTEPQATIQDKRYYEPRYDPEEDAIVNICEYEPDIELNYGFFGRYSAPACGLSLHDLADNRSLWFEELVERGQRLLLLKLKIAETPYYGCTLIERELYSTRQAV